MVNKIYVLGLAKDMDRINRMESRLKEQGFTQDDYYFIAGVDGEDLRLNEDLRHGWEAYPDWKGSEEKWLEKGPPNDPTWSWWCRELKWGEVGCTLSHIGIWELANELVETVPVIILEDDAIICDKFEERVQALIKELYELDVEWDACYLGRDRWGEDHDIGHSTLVKPGFSFCTFGYMISLSGLRKLSEQSLKAHIIPIDEYMAATYSHQDHPRDRIKELVKTKLNFYALKEDIVTQEPKEISKSYTEITRFIK